MILLGASGVDVDGTLYNVEFIDGTCIELYDGCDELADFTFQSFAAAQAASQGLLDQVFLDTPVGLFDSDPGLTNGCQLQPPDILHRACGAMTPFQPPDPVVLLTPMVASNVAVGPGEWVNTNPEVPPDWDSGVPQYSNSGCAVSGCDQGVYARWSLVPEPSTALLLAVGVLEVALRRKRRRR